MGSLSFLWQQSGVSHAQSVLVGGAARICGDLGDC